MLKRVKKWLGIEGVKVELLLPEEIHKSDGLISGTVRLSSIQAQTVTRITFKLIEKYRRGRRKQKLTDEYLLAESELNVLLEVAPDLPQEVPFEVTFDLVKSRMDELEERNIFTRGVARTAKLLKGVSSEYRLEAEADVLGTALNPFDRQPVVLR